MSSFDQLDAFNSSHRHATRKGSHFDHHLEVPLLGVGNRFLYHRLQNGQNLPLLIKAILQRNSNRASAKLDRSMSFPLDRDKDYFLLGGPILPSSNFGSRLDLKEALLRLLRNHELIPGPTRLLYLRRKVAKIGSETHGHQAHKGKRR